MLGEERDPVGTVPGIRTLEGEGFRVRRPFPTPHLDRLGPFLLLDEMGPADNAPGEAKGAPDHPHRGFETVTYVLDGEIEHRDSMGNRGLIQPGDVQWMTAGAGIIHSEMPSMPIIRHGGRVHGFQLWVNLPRSAKMHRPRYQDLTADHLPVAEIPGGSAVVIGGDLFGIKGPAEMFLPITYAHVRVNPDEETHLELDPGHQVFIYAFRGAGHITADRTPLEPGRLAIFDVGGGLVLLGAGPDGLEVMLGSAKPLEEPVARQGPFVMNTREEIIQAFDDFRAGLMGSIDPERTGP